MARPFLTEVTGGFPHFLPLNIEKVPQIRSRTRSSMFFEINFSLGMSSLDGTESATDAVVK
jgi:hypothetical protein